MNLFSIPFDEWLANRKGEVLSRLRSTSGEPTERAREAAGPFVIDRASYPVPSTSAAGVTVRPYISELPAGVPGEKTDADIRVAVRVRVAGNAELFVIDPGMQDGSGAWPKGTILDAQTIEVVIPAAQAATIDKLLARLRRGADRIALLLTHFHQPQAWASMALEASALARDEEASALARERRKLAAGIYPVVAD